MEEKTIDELILEIRPNLRVIANAADLLKLNNDKYAMLRHVGFGASDASKLIGINPYNTLEEMLQEKRNLTPPDPAISSKATVRKGKDLEDLIMKKAEKHLGIKIYKPEYMYGYNDTKLTVNFDGVTKIDDNILIPVEIKVCSNFGRKHYNFDKATKEDINDPNWTTDLLKVSELLSTNTNNCGFPQYYYAQLQQQMLFLDASWGILAVMDDYTWTMHYFATIKNDFMQRDIQIAEIKHRWNLHSEEEIFNKIGLEKGQV